MNGVVDERKAVGVGVDHSTLKGVNLGTETRYTVRLIGPVDAVWTEAYRILQADSTAFRRLRLEPVTCEVSFSCRGIEGPAQVFDILERLDALIKRVNRHVSGRP